MKLWFWRKSKPLPDWASKLSPEQRAVLAENLRAMVEPKKALDAKPIKRRPAPRPLEQSAPLP